MATLRPQFPIFIYRQSDCRKSSIINLSVILRFIELYCVAIRLKENISLFNDDGITMITSKFTIGQRVKHKLLGCLGVILDVDPNYSLATSKLAETNLHDCLLDLPWYHVIIEDEKGETVHTYLAEAQLEFDVDDHDDADSLNDIAHSITLQFNQINVKH